MGLRENEISDVRNRNVDSFFESFCCKWSKEIVSTVENEL